MYTIGVVSDLHCGAHTALRINPQNTIQEKLLAKWLTVAEWLQECDLLIINGDANDGQDPKGRNMQVDDIPWQIAEAEKLIMMIKPKKIRMTTGSSYHVGDTIAYEKFLCGYLSRRGVDTCIRPVQDIIVYDWWRGLFRHAIGRSGVPHGRNTAPTREKIWSTLKSAAGAAETGYVIPPHLHCFSHVHYYTKSEDAFGTAITTPCWKASGGKDKYGAKFFNDHIDIGAVKITITEDRQWTSECKHWTAQVSQESERV